VEQKAAIGRNCGLRHVTVWLPILNCSDAFHLLYTCSKNMLIHCYMQLNINRLQTCYLRLIRLPLLLAAIEVLPVRPTVRPSVLPVLAFNSKTKWRRNTQVGVNVPYSAEVTSVPIVFARKQKIIVITRDGFTIVQL